MQCFAVTVHVPRGYYAKTLPGIPTIRPFEVMACGIPMISAPWHDAEQLFSPDEDFLVVRNGDDMQRQLRRVLEDKEFSQALAERGHKITFYEPDAFERQQHRDIADPNWAEVVVYEANEQAALNCIRAAQGADVIVKASGVGVLDAFLEQHILEFQSNHSRVDTVKIFWDVDAPATLEHVHKNPTDAFRAPLGVRFM